MTSLHLFLLILLMRVAHFSYIVTSIITYATFKKSKTFGWKSSYWHPLARFPHLW